MSLEPPNLEPWNDPAVEARVVAYVLGESSAFEATEVERLLAEHPELAAFARRIRAVHGLLGEDARGKGADLWKLSPERRGKVMALFGAVPVGATVPRETKLDVVIRKFNTRNRLRFNLTLAASVAFGILIIGSMTSRMGGVAKVTVGDDESEMATAPSGEARMEIAQAEAPLQEKSEAPEDYQIQRARMLRMVDQVWETQPAPPTSSSARVLAQSSGEANGKTAWVPTPSVPQPSAETAPEVARLDGVMKGGLKRDLGVALEKDAESQDLASASRGPERGSRASLADPFAPAAGGGGGATVTTRSGDHAITKNAIDSILATPMPDDALKGREDVADVTVTPQGQLSDFKGSVDNGAAIAGKPNERAQIEVIREFTATPGKKLEQPEIPKPVVSMFPITPATPTNFETRIVDGREFHYPAEYDPPELPNSVTPDRQNVAGLTNAGKDGSSSPNQFFYRSEGLTDAVPEPSRGPGLGGWQAGQNAPDLAGGSGKLSDVRTAQTAEGEKTPLLGDTLVVGRLFADSDEKPKSVQVEAKFVEVQQGSTEELGFDWLVTDESAKAQLKNVEGKDPLQAQEERVRESRLKMEKAIVDSGSVESPRFASASGGRGDELDDGSAGLIMRGKVSIAELEQSIGVLRAQIAGLQGLDGDELIEKAATLGIQDATIARYGPQLKDLVRAEKQAEESGFGPDHPQRKAIRSQLDTVKNYLATAVVSVRESMTLQVSQAEKQLEASRKASETEQEEFMQKNLKHVTLQQAQADYQHQQELLKQLQIESLKQSMETSDAAVDPVSTFSLNVSDASFQMGARALLTEGKLPAPDTIRTEDYVNAMDYGDALPGRGEAVSAVVQQAGQPFVPGRNLLRVGIRTGAVGRGQGQPLSLTIMIDQSGSMERPDRAAAVVAAVEKLAGMLQEQDVVTVVGFSNTPRVLADRLPGSKAAELPGLIRQAPPQGGTNLEAALNVAVEAATKQFNAKAQNRIVLITDGAANLGQIDPELMMRRVEALRRGMIAFDACGVGTTGVDDTMLEALTRKGDGRYILMDGKNNENLADVLAGAFRPAARNVKVQVRFNPDRVGRFHLMGFEKHRLAEKDFRDDSVDAAELAAAEQGNALYQMELRADGQGDIGDVAVRFQDTATGEMVERHWTIPYDPQTRPLAEAAPSMQLAGLAGMLAENLKGSPIGQVVRLPELGAVEANLRRHFPNDDRVNTLLQMVARLRLLRGE